MRKVHEGLGAAIGGTELRNGLTAVIKKMTGDSPKNIFSKTKDEIIIFAHK